MEFLSKHYHIKEQIMVNFMKTYIVQFVNGWFILTSDW